MSVQDVVVMVTGLALAGLAATMYQSTATEKRGTRRHRRPGGASWRRRPCPDCGTRGGHWWECPRLGGW